MKKFALLIFTISLVIYPSVVSAQVDIYSNVGSEVIAPTWASQNNTHGSEVANSLSRFRNYREFKKLDSAIPQVVEVHLPQGSQSDKSKYALIEDQTTTLQPFEIISKEKKPTYQVFWVNNNNQALSDVYLSDNNMNTYYEFPLGSVGTQERVVLRFVYSQPIVSQNLGIYFSQDGGVPSDVTLKAINDSNEKIIFAQRPFLNGVLFFPNHSASIWEVTLSHSQPLRMLEAGFSEVYTYGGESKYIRFLMRPGSPYLLFSEPDGYVNMPYLESGNLYSTTDDLVLDLPPVVANPLYRPVDDDADGVSNSADNCPSVKNTDQKDINKNAQGDACEDFDKDYILNGDDNCPEHPNRDQQDTDGDKVGDHCDSEESRLTERLGFLPWLGIVVGFGVVIAIFAFTVRKPVDLPKAKKESDPSK